VRNILDIKMRGTHYGDILSKQKDGYNIYSLAGNNRSYSYLPEKEKIGKSFRSKASQLSISPRGQKTIPKSNLTERKGDVLRIHAENLRMVKRLARVDNKIKFLGRE
jgi:hypothetical protein